MGRPLCYGMILSENRWPLFRIMPETAELDAIGGIVNMPRPLRDLRGATMRAVRSVCDKRSN